MRRFLTDEDFDGRLTSALLARLPGLDLVRVQDVGLMHTLDVGSPGLRTTATILASAPNPLEHWPP